MDVRAKQLLSFGAVLLTQTDLVAVSPHVISAVGLLILYLTAESRKHKFSPTGENMKKQYSQRPQTVLLVTIAAIFLLGAYGSTFAQKKGAITEAEVKAYFTDWWTHDCEKGADCSVTFNSAVRIAPAIRHTFQIPPATYLSYPVKVDFTTHKNGGNFHLQHMTRGVYYFYRNSFGDWEMGKEGEQMTEEKDAHQDGGTTKAPVTDNQTKGGGQTNTPKAENKTAADGKDENGFPKPDFSEMEKWFEIVRYEYPEPPERNMTIFIKPKVDFKQRIMTFEMEFRDKDGIIVGTGASYICCSTQLGDTETGKTGKVTVKLPSEREMEKVVSATIVRITYNY